MKEGFYCRIFGHKFIGNRIEGDLVKSFQLDWCCRCGLTKKEIEKFFRKRGF